MCGNPSITPVRQLGLLAVVLAASATVAPADDLAPKVEERQLPFAMHSEMSERPAITVGRSGADILGTDNRALQAAVDYVAGLGGGVVEIGEGEYLMRDSLHLRSGVTVRGRKGKTILRKAEGAASALALDGDFGEQQITVVDPAGFAVGAGVAIWDDHAGGFHTTVARITGRRGNTFSIDASLMADCMVAAHAKAATVFPVVSGREIQGARVEDLVVEGNKDANVPLNGCRGAGIYLYRGFGTTIRGCAVRNFNGDGISFQQSNDVTVVDCVSEGNTDLGLHPGSGSQRPVVRVAWRGTTATTACFCAGACGMGCSRTTAWRTTGGSGSRSGTRTPTTCCGAIRSSEMRLAACVSARRPRGWRRTVIAWSIIASRTTAARPARRASGSGASRRDWSSRGT